MTKEFETMPDKGKDNLGGATPDTKIGAEALQKIVRQHLRQGKNTGVNPDSLQNKNPFAPWGDVDAPEETERGITV